MSKLVSLVVLLAAAGFAMAVRGTPQSAPTTDQMATTPANAQTATPTHASPLKPGDRNCIRDTGSLIPPKKGSCLPVAGRSYSQQDLDSTGKTTIGPALQQLDPSITVHGRGGQ